MGYADCKYFVGFVETSKEVSIVSLALYQTHCKQVPVFSRLSKSDLITWAHSISSYLRVHMGCALAIVFQFRSLYVPTKNRSPSPDHFWESLVI